MFYPLFFLFEKLCCWLFKPTPVVANVASINDLVFYNYFSVIYSLFQSIRLFLFFWNNTSLFVLMNFSSTDSTNLNQFFLSVIKTNVVSVAGIFYNDWFPVFCLQIFLYLVIIFMIILLWHFLLWIFALLMSLMGTYICCFW